MKPIFISILLLLQAFTYAQITFEEISAPPDFSTRAIRKSPTGEYFIQLSNDLKSIYTSMDGATWAKAFLPENIALDEMQFYSDGTPLIKNNNDAEQMIRRNGSWYTIVKSACFLKNDTLFAFYNKTFSYSLDKGVNFMTIFTTTENISSHTAQLWKFNNYLVLHHTAGASDYLSVFSMDGQRVMYTELASGIYNTLYNACEQVLFIDYNEYYLLKEQGLELYHGNSEMLFPLNADAREMMANGDYYIRDGNTIYKTNSCDFNWEIFAQRTEIETLGSYWINNNGDLVLWENANHFFIEHKNGSGSWDEYQPDIKYPYVIDVNEAKIKNQFALTPHSLFHKQVDESTWTKADTYNEYYGEVQYSPNGDLYVNAESVILYSKDNGIHFESITVPLDMFGAGFTMHVLDNNVILIIQDLGGAFYTINNGNSWANFPVSSLPYEQQFKLVGNYIYVIETEFTYKFARRNILTNEVEVVEFKNLYNFNGYQIAIQDDGTIYFYGWDPTSVLPEGIFRFRFGQELEPLPLLESMAGQDLFESGPYLYTFTSTSYKVYDGITLQAFPITGLPSSSSTKFLIAANEHLMAIVNNNRIFRSKQPLSFSVGTKDIPLLAAFDLFPNPTNSILHISLSDFEVDRVDAFEISDINGRILFNGAFKENEIDVAALQPGIYNLILLKDKIIAGQKKFSKF